MRILILATVLATSLATYAHALPVKWDVSGQLDDGSSVSGSFVYDDNLNAYRNINVSISGGTLGAANFVQATSFANAGFPDFVETGGPDFTGLLNFRVGDSSFDFSDGSTLSYTPTAGDFSEGVVTCLDSTCSNGGNPSATFSSGTFTGTVVPVPAALPLLGTALAGLGVIGWRRNKKTA